MEPSLRSMTLFDLNISMTKMTRPYISLRRPGYPTPVFASGPVGTTVHELCKECWTINEGVPEIGIPFARLTISRGCHIPSTRSPGSWLHRPQPFQGSFLWPFEVSCLPPSVTNQVWRMTKTTWLTNCLSSCSRRFPVCSVYKGCE